ncbi:MAG: hypothetical protein ACXW2P_01895 [Thermoanaerobaculia bacterium]
MGDRNQNTVARLAALIAIALGGAMLRFRALGEPSLWLDEILGYDLTSAAASRSLWSWIIGFDAEHGSLYYATQLAGRIAASPEVEARLLPAIFGTVTVLLVWWAAHASGGRNGAGLAAAAILAVSPLHVYYSREGRPYALAMLLGAALLVALLRGAPRVLLAAVVAALVTSAVTAPLIAAAGVAALTSTALNRERRRSDWIAAVITLLSLAIVPLLYRGAANASTGTDFPDVDASFVDSIIRALSVSAVGSDARGRAAWVMLALAVVGAMALVRRDRRRGAVVIAMALLPIVIALVALWMSGHWFAIRYVCTALPAYVVLIAAGIEALANLARFTLARWMVVILIVGAIATQTIPPAMNEPHRKLDWRRVASTIWRHAHPGDLVMTAEGWSTVSLGFYMRQLPPKMRLVEVADPVIAHALLAEKLSAWMVTAGHSNDLRVRDWYCRFPVVLSSRLEDLRVHYAPSVSDYLATRSLMNERRAVAAARGGNSLVLHLGPADAMFLREGWGQPEGTGPDAFRWVIDGRARIVAPFVTRRDRDLTVRVAPLEHRGLPPQVMEISMNGAPAATFVLQSGAHDYGVRLSAEVWSEDVNSIEFRFARASAPAELDPAQRDPRRLSASFDTITISDAGAAPSPPREHVETIRLQEVTAHGVAPPLDSRTLWRGRTTRFDAARLNEAAVRKLIARLGFDPEVTWPRIVRGEVVLESLMESLATSSTCADDGEFVRSIWVTVFERSPNAIEERVLLSLLRQGPSRRALVERVVRMDELRRQVQSR